MVCFHLNDYVLEFVYGLFNSGHLGYGDARERGGLSLAENSAQTCKNCIGLKMVYDPSQISCFLSMRIG